MYVNRGRRSLPGKQPGVTTYVHTTGDLIWFIKGKHADVPTWEGVYVCTCCGNRHSKATRSNVEALKRNAASQRPAPHCSRVPVLANSEYVAAGAETHWPGQGVCKTYQSEREIHYVHLYHTRLGLRAWAEFSSRQRYKASSPRNKQVLVKS